MLASAGHEKVARIWDLVFRIIEPTTEAVTEERQCVDDDGEPIFHKDEKGNLLDTFDMVTVVLEEEIPAVTT